MKDILLLRPVALGQKQADWLVLRNDKELYSGVLTTLPDCRPDEWRDVSQVWLLLPACDVVFRSVTVSGRKLPPLSWLVEETLVENADHLHWGLLQRSRSTVSIMGASREQLLAWHIYFSTLNLTVTRAIPDALLLPWQPDSVTLYACRDQWWVRSGQHQALIAEALWLPQVLSHFGDLQQNLVDTFANDILGLLRYLAPLAKKSKINLLPCLIKNDDLFLLSALKKSTWLVLITGMFLLAGLPIYKIYTLHHARIESERVLLDIWKRYFYDEPVDRNVGYWFMQRKQSMPHSLINELLALNETLHTKSELQLQQLSFQKQPARLELVLNNPPTESLQEFMAASHFKIDGIRNSPDRVVLSSPGGE